MGIPDSGIVYFGPSAFDSSVRIVGVVTGMRRASKNPKTGRMAQLFILCADVDPITAIHTGQDAAICNQCGLRGCAGKARGCYVAVKNAPLAVWNKFTRGHYPILAPDDIRLALSAKDRALRLGAYGDPGALPAYLVRRLTDGIRRTGYTHTDNPAFAGLVMRSVDSPREYIAAVAAGYRTFRTRTPQQPLLPGEIACPASDESGKRTTCERCGLCDGKTSADDLRRNIAILAHGTNTIHALNFIRSHSAAA